MNIYEQIAKLPPEKRELLELMLPKIKNWAGI